MAKNPRYPVIPLGEAISRAKTIYEKEHLSTLTPTVAAEAMGYKGLNGASLRVIGALRQFGLLEGRGEDVKITKDAQTLIIDDASSPDYVAAIRRAFGNPQVFADLRKQFPGSASERNMAVFLEKQGFKPDAAADAAKNYKDSLTLVPTDSQAYDAVGEDEQAPANGEAPMQPQEQSRAQARPPGLPPPPAGATSPLRVVMNGNRLDIQASVDLAGLKKLQEMLAKYQSILEMLEPEEVLLTDSGKTKPV